MRKFVVFVVALLYLASVSGATMHMHFCMGELVDAGLYPKPSKTCGKCGMEKQAEKDNGCCKDEHKFVKLDDDQKAAAQQLFNLKVLPSVAIVPCTFEATQLPATLTERFPFSNAPPPLRGTAIYVRNCVFRI